MINEAQRKINDAYNLYGFTWKDKADSLFTSGDAVEVWNNIRLQGLLPPPNNDILILSPTAWIPRHEIAIWENETEVRKGNTVVVAGDIRAIDLDAAECTLPPQKNDASFHYIRLNAARIPLRNDSVDVIWDRKGWLWHVANEAYGDYMNIECAFDYYHNLLKKNGIIVLDANPNNPLIDIINGFVFSSQMEPSTVDMIRRRNKKKARISGTV